MKRTRKQLVFYLVLWIIVISSTQPITSTQSSILVSETANASHTKIMDSNIVSEGVTVLQDDFDASLGYNDSLWDLESFENGSVSWVEGEYFNMTAERHSFRTLSSKDVFSVGHEATIQMSMQENEAVVCVGFTNATGDKWNYLFYNDSLYFEEAYNTMLLARKIGFQNERTAKILSGFNQSEFHTYRLVWNSTAAIAYVDGVRLGAIGGEMPSGPLHFKITITENRNQTTEGWLCIDSVEIKEHSSMIDENPPFITLNSPGNGTLNLPGETIEVIPVGSDEQLFWSWDGITNETGYAPYDIILPETEGLHTLDVYCKDGYGYENWNHVRYIFTTMVTPPILDTAWCSSAPTIDGVIEPDEWPILAEKLIEFVREDGTRLSATIYLGCDDSFVYVGFDSPVPAGHDSRASLILNGLSNGTYQGRNVTPIITAYYTKGSPQCWEGYDELKYIWEEDGSVHELKLEPIPSGFLSFSSEQGLNVHYEFRFPLEELGAKPGSTIGLALMLFPTGMGVHNLFYPITYPWDSASKLVNLRIAQPPNTLLIQGSIAIGAIGLVAIAAYLGWTKKPRGTEVLAIESESIQRVRSVVESYDKISLERLSQMTNLSETEVKDIVLYLIDQKEVDARIVGEEIMRG